MIAGDSTVDNILELSAPSTIIESLNFYDLRRDRDFYLPLKHNFADLLSSTEHKSHETRSPFYLQTIAGTL